MRRRLAVTLIVVLGVAACATAGVALAFAPADDVAISPYASGFSSEGGIGPVGVAFDGAGNLFVSSRGNLYRFGPGGGSASGRRVNDSAIGGQISGLAFGRSGKLYAARRTSASRGDVVELSTGTGQVVRKVATGLPCPTGLAADPVSNALVVTAVGCQDSVFRLSGGQKTTILRGVFVDGVTFAPDGTLYLAHDGDANGYTVSSLSSDGTRTGLAKVPHPDGIAIATGDAATGGPPFLVVNRTDGRITRIDLSRDGHPSRDLMTNGTRGDFVAVGDDGCLYATQTNEVLRLTNADGSCKSDNSNALLDVGIGAGLAPTGAPIEPAAAAYVQVRGGSSRSPACATNRRIKVRFRAPGGIRVTRARLYLGKRLARTVSGRALRRSVTVTRLPKRKFTLTIRAKTKRGRTVTVRRKYKACAGVAVKARKKKRR